MAVRRSTESIPAVSVEEPVECSICKNRYNSKDIIVSAPCHHIFHKTCITHWVRSSATCPICRGACTSSSLKPYKLKAKITSGLEPTQVLNPSIGTIPKRTTRSQNNPLDWSMNNTPAPSSINSEINENEIREQNLNLDTNLNNENMSMDRLQELIQESLSRQQNNLLQAMTSQVERLLVENLNRNLGNMNISGAQANGQLNTSGNSNQNRSISQGNRVNQEDSRTNRYDNDRLNTSGNSYRERSVNQGNRRRRSPIGNNVDAFASGKISNIMANWNLKFSGQNDEYTVDNFLYRVNALTRQSLNGNFSVLCDQFHMLLSGHALDWYWRFHEMEVSRNGRVVWNDLCEELRDRFRDIRDQEDIMELLRNRKQKENESFDHFYTAFLKISDRLEQPLRETELVKLIRRNLKPSVKQSILHCRIIYMRELREYCQKYEYLEDEVKNASKSVSQRRFVSEIVPDCSEIVNTVGLEVEALSQIVCWNCKETGHKFDECLGQRTVFCYGCGAEGVYKPTCTNCSVKSKNYKRPHTADTNR